METRTLPSSASGSLNTEHPNLEEFGNEQHLDGYDELQRLERAAEFSREESASPGLRAVLQISDDVNALEPPDLTTPSIIERPKSSGISLTDNFTFAKRHQPGKNRPSDTPVDIGGTTNQTSTTIRKETVASNGDGERAGRPP